MRLRPPVPADAAAILEVIVARDIADLGAPDFTLEDLREEWGAGWFHLEVDAVVAELGDGRIGGYAAVRRPGTLSVVAPEHEGQGIGASLLEWTQARDRALGRERHQQVVASTDARGQALLHAAGYRLERSYWRMTRQLDDGVSAVDPPAGLSLRALEIERDGVAVHALDARSFSAVPDYRAQSFEEFRHEHLAVHDVAPQLSLVAESERGVVGFLLSRRWAPERVGFIDLLAVDPDHQGRGLGTALLTTTFALFAAAGLREAQLGVASDNPKALRVYERAGMRERFRGDAMERPVTGD